jgi:hypothetical protein
MNILTQRAVGTFSDHKTTDLALHELKDRGFMMDKVSVIGRDIYHYPEFTGANTSDRLVNTSNLATDETRGRLVNTGNLATDETRGRLVNTSNLATDETRGRLVNAGNLATDETRSRFVDAGNLPTDTIRDPSVDLATDENKAKETAVDGAIAGSTIGGFAGLLVGLGALAIPGVGPVMLAGAAATAIATAISGSVIGAAAGSLTGGLVGLGIPEDRAKLYDDRIAQGDYLVIVEGSEADIKLAKSIFNKHDIDNWHIYDVSSNPVTPIEIENPRNAVIATRTEYS